MAEDQGVLALPGKSLPEEMRRKLKRARHVHRRGMRAPLNSNEREACMEEFHDYVKEAADEAASLGIPYIALPQWAIDHFKEEPVIR